MIVTGDRERQVTIDCICRRMREAYNAVGDLNSNPLAGVSPHDLRYTTVSVLTELGCSDDVISFSTGHQTVAMVRKYQEKKH